ncbi:MAG: hypothetical protein RLZ29_801, partial [Actinomycetota bacterium]
MRLIAEGYVDITVVDISQRALDEARDSSPQSSVVVWVCA